MRVIKGSYAFALIDRTAPDVIYVAKNKSPLLIGLGDGFNVIASDAMAMLAHTKEFVEIEDEEMVTVTSEKVIIQNFAGDIVERSSFEAQSRFFRYRERYLSFLYAERNRRTAYYHASYRSKIRNRRQSCLS